MRKNHAKMENWKHKNTLRQQIEAQIEVNENLMMWLSSISIRKLNLVCTQKIRNGLSKFFTLSMVNSYLQFFPNSQYSSLGLNLEMSLKRGGKWWILMYMKRKKMKIIGNQEKIFFNDLTLPR